MDEQECFEFYQATGLGSFYGYDEYELQWRMILSPNGHYYINEMGWITTECSIKMWYPI